MEIKSKQTEKILYKPKPLRIPKPSGDWYVYILQCNDNSLYTGVTNDLQKRMNTHASGSGSKYVKAKGFCQLLRFHKCKDKIDAQQKEYKIKQLPTQNQKLAWFTQNK